VSLEDDIKRMFTTAIPLLRAAGINKKIVLTPLEIYHRGHFNNFNPNPCGWGRI
jgi:hypothetical protein